MKIINFLIILLLILTPQDHGTKSFTCIVLLVKFASINMRYICILAFKTTHFYGATWLLKYWMTFYITFNYSIKVTPIWIGFNKGPYIISSAELTVTNFMLEKISKTLLMADHDHKNWESLFLQLAKKSFLIHDDDKIDNKTVSWYIGEPKMLNTLP